MNCDDVFEALTDPSCCPSIELEVHLAGCPRCRQLEQVLEPARSLLCGELPVERATAIESPNENPVAARPLSLLSLEAVGMAEAIAVQLAASSGQKSVPPRRKFAIRQLCATALRSAALILFGAMAVYCIGPRGGESELQSLPAVIPHSGPAKTCTRGDLQRTGKSSQQAESVILSCVACHLNDRHPQRPPVATSQFWPRQRSAAPTISLANCAERNGAPTAEHFAATAV